MRAWSAPEVPDVGHRSHAVANQLNLYDTASSAIKAVGPNGDEPDQTARLYVCGITPYDATHLGHAFTYVTFDLVNRQWRDLGHDVLYAQNITDVDDPLLERAAATGVDWEDLAHDQIQLFRDDMEALRVLPPQHYVGVVECVQCVGNLIDQMRPSGAIYQIDDPEYPDWYFNSAQAPGFGGVGHLSPDEQVRKFAEMGGDPDRPGKRHPLDCLVWRMARPGEPSWDSSLGRGRPGWHIECTAIALKYLGPDFDVQGGGSDLAFPHHEMCAAEGVVATGEEFASAFVHSAMVALDGEKMSKSKGNLELVSRLRREGADPMAIRLALISHRYRDDWEWTPQALDAATRRLANWRAGLAAAGAVDAEVVVDGVRGALRNDLDTPWAIEIIDEWAQASQSAPEQDRESAALVASAVDALLGIAL